MLIYDSLVTYREFYCHYAQKLLEELNEVVLIVPFYETLGSVREMLSIGHRAIDVEEQENLKNLFIHDSVDEYFGNEIVMDSRKKILNEAIENGKEGFSVVADMGSFFFKGAVKKLLEYEMNLPTRFEDKTFSGICVYHQADFDRLSKDQKNDVINHHRITIKLEAY